MKDGIGNNGGRGLPSGIQRKRIITSAKPGDSYFWNSSDTTLRTEIYTEDIGSENISLGFGME